MIFAVNNHPQVIQKGTKTRTRRRATAVNKYKVGKTYAIQPKRTAKGIPEGRILVTNMWLELKENPSTYPISVAEALAEGGYTPEEYERLYEKINPKWVSRCAIAFDFVPTAQLNQIMLNRGQE